MDEARGKGAQVVILLSHNGMDVDLKLAGRVTGIDAILGGHTHDGVPQPVEVRNAKGVTLVTNAGSNGKFLGVMDFDVKGGKVAGWKYRLLPVFANLLAPDAGMAAILAKIRGPHEAKLAEKLAVTEGLLYRRGNFNGTVDQVILDALMQVKGAEIAFSPGFRWGTTLLPGQAITLEHVMDWTAISYPQTTLNEFTGEMIKTILEDVCDNLFNPDPYYQQGGDMVRVGGLTYTCTPGESMGKRISDMRLAGKPVAADRKYKVAGWAPVAEGVKGEPIWDVVTKYLRDREDDRAREAEPPEARRHGRQSRDRLMAAAADPLPRPEASRAGRRNFLLGMTALGWALAAKAAPPPAIPLAMDLQADGRLVAAATGADRHPLQPAGLPVLRDRAPLAPGADPGRPAAGLPRHRPPGRYRQRRGGGRLFRGVARPMPPSRRPTTCAPPPSWRSGTARAGPSPSP